MRPGVAWQTSARGVGAGLVRTQPQLLSLVPPPFLFPVFQSAGGSSLVAASGRNAVQGESVLAACHVLRSLRHVSEPGALCAAAAGLQQHHPDMQRQHSADQPSQWAGDPAWGRGPSRRQASGTAWTRSPMGLLSRPYLTEAASGSPLRGQRAAIPSLSGPGSPRVPSPRWSSGFFSGVPPSLCGGQNWRPDSPRVGEGVCPVASSEGATWRSGQPSFSCHLPSLHPPRFLFGQFWWRVVYWFKL